MGGCSRWPPGRPSSREFPAKLSAGSAARHLARWLLAQPFAGGPESSAGRGRSEREPAADELPDVTVDG
jgi:hypothetical protein